MGTPKILVERWKNFLTEREYTDEELANDILWNDLHREDIDGFFWGAGDGTLESYTGHIRTLARDLRLTIANEEQFKKVRNKAMEHSSISAAFKELVPERDISFDDTLVRNAAPGTLTDPGSRRAAQRQSSRKEKETEGLIDKVIDDIIQSLGGKYSPDEILNKIQTRASARKK
jgi:hypothetical protein